MNIVSQHNRLLQGSPVYTAGGDMWTSGLEYTQNGEISGYSGSAFYQQECPCDSAAIVDSAFNQSTAWVDEQGYLTAHQDVTNLPYVQNSALEFSPQGLISGISGSGLYATSAENAFTADTAYFAYNAEHSDSADYAENSYSAQFANSASSALNAEVANVSYTALTAHFLDQGWEHDDDGFITAYNNSAFAGNGGGGFEYEGIEPIVVDNDHHLISAKSALLGVQGPLYFVEDSETATVIGIYESAFPTFETNDAGEVSAINGSAIYASNVVDYSGGNNIDITDHVISVTGSVPSADRADYAVSATSSHYTHSAIEAASADSATYDNLGREITATYLTAEVEYTAGANIDITNHVVSGKDWTNDIQSASSYAYDQATAQIPAVTGLPYVENSALDYTPGGHLVSSISGDALYAVSAEGALNAETANYSYVAETANYVADGWEYNESNEITGYSGSAIHSEAPSEGKVYTGVAPIVVDNSPTTGVISAQTARLGVQEPLYFVEDTSASTVIGISGIPEVEGLMYESALESADGKITGYNGTAFSAGSTYDVKASANISVSTAGNTFTVSGKDWQNTITAASSYAYNQATADATGKYIPYTNITTGDSGTQVYNVNKGIRVTSTSGWTEMYGQNKENENEAHLQIGQNYNNGKSFWAELDGAGGGVLQMNWNSGTINPNAHVGYSDGTCSALDIGNGSIVYASSISSIKDNYENSKVWQIGSERVRFWNQWGTASFGPKGIEMADTTGNATATLNASEINNLKALLNHVKSASASWVNPSTSTGSI